MPRELFLTFFFIIYLVKVSVFDSVVQGGDAVWEGLHIYDGKAFKLDEHLDRCSI
jgi:protein-lysine N-methyltransferase EEF2KMT